MTYSLVRESDAAGDSGPVSLALWIENGEPQTEHDARPRVGVALQVGSLFARSYSAQDYWQTTIIEEILIDQEDYVKFRTRNSIYEWKKF